MSTMEDRLLVAIDAAERAGRRIAYGYERAVSVETKSSAIDLVTDVDREAEAIALATIRASFVDDAVLAEESGASEAASGAARWLVDPLDGTTNFAHGFPHFGVSIAVAQDDALEVGVVHDPLRRETFFARRGHGAWLRTPGLDDRRLSVGRADALERSLLATGFGYDRATAERDNLREFSRVLRRVRGVRRAGSAALDLAYVAAGRLDGYWEYGLAPWDWAAGVVLVREAGGETTTMAGTPYCLGDDSLCVANPVLLPRLRAALRGEA